MLTVEKKNGETTVNNTEDGEEFQYECGFCDSSFSSFRLRNEHTDEVHSDIQEFRCKYCGHLFKSKLSLYPHLEIHSKNKDGTEKPFKCSVCNGGFNDKVRLKRHIQWCREDKKKVVNYRHRRAPMQLIKNHREEIQTCSTITVNGEFEAPLLQPELVSLVKSEPQEFVFVNYLDNPPVNNKEQMNMSSTPADLRLLIEKTLEFYEQNPMLEPGVSNEQINFYLEETFNVRTDCLNELNEMVRDGIITRSDSGKYSNVFPGKEKDEDKPDSPVKTHASSAAGSGAWAEEKDEFNRLMREVLARAQDSPVGVWDILICLKSLRTNWFTPLPPRIKRYLEMNVKNGSVVKTRERFRYRYRLVNAADLQRKQSNDDENRRLDPIPGGTIVKPQMGMREELKYECKYCGLSFWHKGRLTGHLKIHSKVAQERLFKCSGCKAGFHNNIDLTKHFEKVHAGNGKEKFNVPSNDGPTLECGVCQFFSTIQQLEMHIEHTHHKPSVPIEGVLECGMCPETFVNHKDRLKHSSEVHYRHTHRFQVYKCKTCGSKKSEIGELYRHFNTHKDGKFRPHKCPHCSVAFAYVKQLKSHFLSVHQSRKRWKTSTRDPDMEPLIKSEPGTDGTHSDTFGSLSGGIGKQSESDAIGSQSDAIGRQSDGIGSQSDTIGSQTDTIRSQSDAIGKQSDTVGSRSDTTGNNPNGEAAIYPFQQLDVRIKEEEEDFVAEWSPNLSLGGCDLAEHLS